MRSTPIVWSPKRMMTAPAMRLKIDCHCARNWPMALAAAPRDMKTRENPMMKARDEITT